MPNAKGIKTSAWRLPDRNWAVPQPAIHPVVHLVYRFRIGGRTTWRKGTGFFAARWRRALVTAAHVMETFEDMTPRSLEVWAFGRRKRYRLYASAFAYPKSPTSRRDVAVIVLGRAVRQLSHTLPVAYAPTGEFDAELVGRLTSKSKPKSVDVVGQKRGPWIEYTDGNSMDGMSGGPLLWYDSKNRRNKVLASHIGVVAAGYHFPGALELSAPMVRACLNAADRAR